MLFHNFVEGRYISKKIIEGEHVANIPLIDNAYITSDEPYTQTDEVLDLKNLGKLILELKVYPHIDLSYYNSFYISSVGSNFYLSKTVHQGWST